MKTAKDFLVERAGELFCMVHSTTCAKIVGAMEAYANQETESLNAGLQMQNIIMDRMKDEIEILKNPPIITSAG